MLMQVLTFWPYDGSTKLEPESAALIKSQILDEVQKHIQGDHAENQEDKSNFRPFPK